MDVVPAVRAEAVQGEGVADAVERVRQQHRGCAREIHHRILLAAHLVVRRLRHVEQDHHRQVAQVALVAHHDPRVGLLTHADVDHRAHGGIDVQLVAVLDPADALHALRDHRLDQELQARDHRLVVVDDLLDELELAELGPALQHRHPARALELNLVVPLVVVVGVGDRLPPFQLVDGLALLVEPELGGQHPDLFRVVAGELVVDLVHHLHDVDLLAHLLGRPGRLQGASRSYSSDSHTVRLSSR